MSRESVRHVSFSPDTTTKTPLPFLHRRSHLAAGFIDQLKAKLATALCFACLTTYTGNTNYHRKRRSSRRVMSSSSLLLTRSRSYAEPIVDTHRAEAVEDCIEFLNASAFRRSTSVSASANAV